MIPTMVDVWKRDGCEGYGTIHFVLAVPCMQYSLLNSAKIFFFTYNSAKIFFFTYNNFMHIR